MQSKKAFKMEGSKFSFTHKLSIKARLSFSEALIEEGICSEP